LEAPSTFANLQKLLSVEEFQQVGHMVWGKSEIFRKFPTRLPASVGCGDVAAR
jgi:hypothetical protein